MGLAFPRLQSVEAHIAKLCRKVNNNTLRTLSQKKLTDKLSFESFSVLDD